MLCDVCCVLCFVVLCVGCWVLCDVCCVLCFVVLCVGCWVLGVVRVACALCVVRCLLGVGCWVLSVKC